MADLFDMKLRALRRDRAANVGPERFLAERIFEDCIERVEFMKRDFERALLIGCLDPEWPGRLRSVVAEVEVKDPGPLLATRARGEQIIEDAWEPPLGAYDLVIAVGTLDTVNNLPLALRLILSSMHSDGLIIGALSGGDTLPQLRSAMRVADMILGVAAAHVHPRIEASALSPLLIDAGFVKPVVDVERVEVSYPSLERLVSDLRAMGATNLLRSRPPSLTREQRRAAFRSFAGSGQGSRTTETFETLYFTAWAPDTR
ncbi:MAG TPA: SAM-dependent methyltransferase [Sphingomicrobium sp.]|nr:SAM-dependent methyltransferase [Sphingomicrobium sp.]